ncbi:MAG: thrombospondin type 3 repeat-containing protein [Pseudomonadota bacterium]
MIAETGLNTGGPNSTVARGSELIGPLNPYLSFADSPFSPANGGQFDEFYLEDFEDFALDTPGVSGSGMVFTSPTNADSVDADDGIIDGNGSGGVSYRAGPPIPTVAFDFEPIFDGNYPSHVGLVWTDGLPMNITTTFEAFDGNGASLGLIEAMIADGSNTGETADDHFFGAVSTIGISRVTISNNNVDTFSVEMDHLQYGRGLVCLDSLDRDGDGVSDLQDNCIAVSNADQRDTNGDGFGNVCDTDLNNDGVVNFSDLQELKMVFFDAGDLDADFNGDFVVNFLDLIVMKETFFGFVGPSCTN